MDISERHRVEQVLRENEEQLAQLKRLLDLSRDPIFIWDYDGAIVDWNRGSEELYGYSREEARGKLTELLLRTTVPNPSFDELRTKLLQDGKLRPASCSRNPRTEANWLSKHVSRSKVSMVAALCSKARTM